MTKRKEIIWIILFMLVIASSNISYFFLEKHVNTQNYEQRAGAEKPKLSTDNFRDFPKKYEAYYNDNLAFRNQLIRLNNSIDYFLFHKSSSEKVAIGNDGWLFYCAKDDYNALEQSLGYWTLQQDFLETVRINLVNTERVLASQGVDFVVFIAPNKETTYLDKVPDYYQRRTSYTAVDQLVDYLRENTDLKVVYPKEALLEARRSFPNIDFYHKLDTHWNNAGGYVAAREVAGVLGITMPNFGDVTVEEIVSDTGDLARMLNIRIPDGNLDYKITDYTDRECVNEIWDFETYLKYSTKGADPRRLVVRRDSYSSAVAEYLGAQFEYSNFVHSLAFSEQIIIDEKADIFVYETVERYFRNLGWTRISYVRGNVDTADGCKKITLTHALKTENEPIIDVIKKTDSKEEILLEGGLIPDGEILCIPETETGQIMVTVYVPEWSDEPVETVTIEY